MILSTSWNWKFKYATLLFWSLIFCEILFLYLDNLGNILYQFLYGESALLFERLKKRNEESIAYKKDLERLSIIDKSKYISIVNSSERQNKIFQEKKINDEGTSKNDEKAELKNVDVPKI